MKEKKSPIKSAASLRERAEEKISTVTGRSGEINPEKMSAAEIRKLIAELHIHQIELEMQNESLRSSQMEIAEANRKYTELYDFAPVGYFTLDKKGYIREANVTGATLLAFDKRSLIGEPFYRFIVPECFGVFQSHLREAAKTLIKQSCRLKLSGREDTRFDGLIETTTALDNDGKFDHYRLCLTDITELTKQEELVHYLATFPLLSPTPIMELDMDGSIHFMNPAAEQLFPDVRRQGVKHPWLAEWEMIVAFFQTGKVEETAREIQIGDRWFGQSLHLMEGGGKIRIYGREISKRKQAEIDLQKKNMQLENAGKEMESFSYGVSHGFQAPLRAVAGYTRMILKKHRSELDENMLEKLNVISTNAQRISRLIDDLVTFTRMARARLSMFMINMDDLVRETWKDLQKRHPERSINLNIDPLPPAKGDLNLIKQVLDHIFSNAVKFTRAQEDTLVAVGGREDGDEVVYYIKDNGIGFDMKDSDRLFNVFQRLHEDDGYEGSGVGLALVQSIIQRHGGRVWAEGEVNQGACFYFTLPKG